MAAPVLLESHTLNIAGREPSARITSVDTRGSRGRCRTKFASPITAANVTTPAV
jgi:hypothetical protein